MYLQPQTVHKHTLTEITELAAILEVHCMLTVATFLHSTRIGSTVSGWVVIRICDRDRSVTWSVKYVKRTAVPSTRRPRTSFSCRRPTTRFYYDVSKASTLHGLGRSTASTDTGPPTTVEGLTVDRITSAFHQPTPVVKPPQASTTIVGLGLF